MLTFFINHFIQNPEDVQDTKVRQSYGILCGAIGIVLNFFLFLGKLLAGLLGNSISIMADAFNNLSDAASSLITLIGFKIAGQKPDSDHPFGHGRLEYISGMMVSFLILLMSFELIKTSLGKILHPQKIQYSPLLSVILLVSILIKCYMAFYNRKIGAKISSTAMKATATDSLCDMISTSVVWGCTLLSHYTSLSLDGYCGLLVGLFVGYAGFKAAQDTINPLLGQAPDPEFVNQIQELVLSQEGIIGIHDLIVHNYGPGRVLISLHAEVPADGDVLVMHDRIDSVEHLLRSTLNCSAVIHMDPVCVNDKETMQLKTQVQTLLEDIAPGVTMHDFRIVKGPTHTNLIFDIVVPYQYPIKDEDLIVAIKTNISQIDPSYFTVLEIDKPGC